MSTVSEKPGPHWSPGKLRRYFWNVPMERIILQPVPGTVTEEVAIEFNERFELAELVDGCLVRKTMGAFESLLAMRIGQHINNYLDLHPLGFALGADGMVRLMPGMIRIPDVCFISHERLGSEVFPDVPTLREIPELAIEVISQTNTKKEMRRKLEDYFSHGVQEVWMVYPRKKSVDVYTSVDAMETRTEFLDGGTILPGFTLSLQDIFKSTGPKK